MAIQSVGIENLTRQEDWLDNDQWRPDVQVGERVKLTRLGESAVVGVICNLGIDRGYSMIKPEGETAVESAILVFDSTELHTIERI